MLRQSRIRRTVVVAAGTGPADGPQAIMRVARNDVGYHHHRGRTAARNAGSGRSTYGHGAPHRAEATMTGVPLEPRLQLDRHARLGRLLGGEDDLQDVDRVLGSEYGLFRALDA